MSALMADAYFGRTSHAQCDDTAEALRRLYPGNQANDDTIGPIEPDILGEAALARLVEDRRANGEALVAATLEDALAVAHGDRRLRRIRNALQVIRRARYHPEERTRTAMTALVRSLESWCQSLRPEAAGFLEDALPQFTLDWQDLAIAAAGRAVAYPPPTAALPPQLRSYAGRIAQFIHRLISAEQFAAALPWCERQIATLKDLPITTRAERRELASAHNNLALVLCGLERPAQAHAEQLKSNHLLGQEAGDESERATALMNEGKYLFAMRRYADSLTRSRQAVALLRPLAAQEPRRFQRPLAEVLHNIAHVLVAVGHADEALEPARESHIIVKSLLDDDVDACLLMLAENTHVLMGVLSQLQRLEEAMQVGREALPFIHHGLLKNRPRFLKPFAGISQSLALLLLQQAEGSDDSNQARTAAGAAAQCVALCRELITLDRARYLPALAASLNMLARSHLRCGRQELSCGVARQAVELARETQPAILTVVMQSLCECLKAAGNNEELLEVSGELAQLHRSLSDEGPIRAVLSARAAGMQVDALIALGRSDAAFDAANAAVVHATELLEHHADWDIVAHAATLERFARALMLVNQTESAVTCIEGALELLRQSDQQSVESRLTMIQVLNSAVPILFAAHRTDDARAAAQSAVSHCRPDVTTRAGLKRLAEALVCQGRLLYSMSVHSAAIESFVDALEQLRLHTNGSAPELDALYRQCQNYANTAAQSVPDRAAEMTARVEAITHRVIAEHLMPGITTDHYLATIGRDAHFSWDLCEGHRIVPLQNCAGQAMSYSVKDLLPLQLDPDALFSLLMQNLNAFIAKNEFDPEGIVNLTSRKDEAILIGPHWCAESALLHRGLLESCAAVLGAQSLTAIFQHGMHVLVLMRSDADESVRQAASSRVSQKLGATCDLATWSAYEVFRANEP